MNGLAKRHEADIARLRSLAASSRGQLELVEGTLEPAGRSTGGPIELKVNLPTAGSANYPREVRREIRLRIDLPPRYPFEAPTARLVGTPVFHPNVFESGVICVGSKWLASEGLDLYVLRVVRLLCFDGMLVNMNSVAHAVAGRWYAQARRQYPEAFPTALVDWAHVAVEKVVRPCPACGTRMRLPAGRTGQVQCPRCDHEFEAST